MGRTDANDVIAAPPSGLRRRAVNVFILGMLAFHLAMPLRFYLGDRRGDERFSWRMFASTNRQTCNVAVYEISEDRGKLVERRLRLEAILPSRWRGVLDRWYDRDVVASLLLWLADQRPTAKRFRYEGECFLQDGSRHSSARVIIDVDTRQVRYMGPP